jgi:N-acetylmuramate 1-kinase
MEDLRKHILQKWLIDSCCLEGVVLHAMPGDASFRRYFRVQHATKTYVAMDAPIERDDSRPYIAISKALHTMGLHTPQIIYSDLEQGFLLLTDLGDRQLLKELNTSNAEWLYGRALNALAILQSCSHVPDLKIPPFTAHFMRQELMLFQEWFLETYLKLNLSDTTQKMLTRVFDRLVESIVEQPLVFMHRDYHSANLMVLPEHNIGILDFQDAFMGPVTYDLVSLLRDCYIAWPDELINKLVLRYHEQLNLSVSSDEFNHWFDWMGLQRHMKTLLTFSRKFERDHNSNYLQHIPRTLDYITNVSAKYPPLSDFHLFFEEMVCPAFKKGSIVCGE